eukprot:TRINITY_DN62333_c0_g1_i1.p1 TRINITY_DN62333_c0_g1~~TRINITY_DN62333_c0_g1_i1.p1  ORF type:complete len:1002 (-),score=229.71 TRINITY_DN62333_c0_g1_i1:51-3056(-)
MASGGYASAAPPMAQQDQELCQLLTALCSDKTPERRAAEAALEGARLRPGFAAKLSAFGAGGPPGQDVLPLRQMALTVLKRITLQSWSELSEGDQAAVCQALLAGVCNESKALRGLLHACIANARARCPWPDLHMQLAAGLSQGNAQQASCCVECITTLLEECSVEVAMALGALQEPMLRLASAEASPPELRRQCVSAHLAGVSTVIACEDIAAAATEATLAALPPWLTAYAALCTGVESWDLRERVSCAFSALRAVTSLCRYRALETALAESMEAVLRPACVLVQNLQQVYEQAVIHQDDAGASEEEGGASQLIAQMMELLQVMVVRPKLRPMLKNKVKSLIQLLVPFMRITEAQASSWRSDPNEFLAQEEDEHVRGCAVRLSGEGLVGELLESFKREGARAVAGMVGELLERGESSRAAGDPHAWKLSEVSLYIFGIASTEVSVKALQRGELGPLVPTVLTKCAQLSGDKAAPEFLRARAFSLLHRLADAVCQLAKAEVPKLLEASAAGLAPGEPLVVRVSACRVFCRFLTNVQDDALRQDLLLNKGVLSSLGSLLRDADEELLHLCLECLCIIVKQCPGTMVAVERDLAPLILEIWRRCASDPLVHMQVLDLVSCCVGSDARLQTSMEERLLPAVATDLQAGADPHLASSAIELFGVLLKRAAVPFGPKIWACAGPVVATAMLSDESMMLQNACETLVSLVQRSPQQVVDGGLLEPLLRLVERLLGPDLEDDACLYVGPFAMLLFAQYGSVLPGELKVGLLRALVTRLTRAERPYLRQELVVVFARLLHEDLGGALAALAGIEVPSGEAGARRGALELLLSTWLGYAKEIRAKRARNVTVSALCRLHERCREDSQLGSLRTLDQPDRPLPHQLLEAIVAGLEFENDRCKRLNDVDDKALECEDDEDDEEDDDDDDVKPGACSKKLSDLIDMEDWLDDDDDGSDAGGDTFQELERQDPLASLDLRKVTAEYLTSQAEACQALDAELAKRLLQAVLEARA